MIKTDYVKLYEALLLIQKTCGDSSSCYNCPLADSTGKCRVVSRRSSEDGFYNIKPGAWKLISDIHMFREEENNATN